MKHRNTLRRSVLGLDILMVPILLHSQAVIVDPAFNPSDIGFYNGDGARGSTTLHVPLPDGRILLAGNILYNGTLLSQRAARLTADGKIDPTYDLSGNGPTGSVYAVCRQPDDKMLVVGGFTSYAGAGYKGIVRLEPDGAVDPGFDPGDGLASVSEFIKCIALQADGGILIGGNFTSFDGVPRHNVARLNSDGSLDLSFDPGLGASNWVSHIEALPDGRVLVGGKFQQFDGTPCGRLVRLDPDGSLDPTFNIGSGANNAVEAITTQPDGRILVGGAFSSFNGSSCGRIVRLMADGTIDATFDATPGANGVVRAILVQDDEKLMLGGSFSTCQGTTRKRIARIHANGALDGSFDPGSGPNGMVVGISRLPDGRYLLGGNGWETYAGVATGSLARINTNGTFDHTFNAGTGANGPIVSLERRSNGKILIAGGFREYNNVKRNSVARLHADGGLDMSFDPGESIDFNVHGAVFHPFGGVIVHGQDPSAIAGQYHGRVIRLTGTGAVDPDFVQGDANDEVREALVQPDGRILVAGRFTTYNGVPRARLARLNADGSLDLSFIPPAGVIGVEEVTGLALTPDGRIYASDWHGAHRFNTDGSVDPVFTQGSGPNIGGIVHFMLLLPDGRLLLGGDFSSYNGTSAANVVRLGTDGVVDTTFVSTFNPPGPNDVAAMVCQVDGRIVLTYNCGSGEPGIARLEPDGAVDASFDPGTGFDAEAWLEPTGLALQPDGRILVAGNFIKFNGVGRNRIMRLKSIDCTVGAPCDDGDPTTVNDSLDASCTCMGEPDPACPITQLTTTADPVISCGATDLDFSGGSIIAAAEVAGANKYQFHFTNVAGQPEYVRNIAFPARTFVLQSWTSKPLKAGRSYHVTVRASFDNGNTWCAFGPDCTISISSAFSVEEYRSLENEVEAAQEVFPNPSTDGVFYLVRAEDIREVLVHDRAGREVLAMTAVSIDPGPGPVRIELGSRLENGIYLITVRTDGSVRTYPVMLSR